MANSEDAEPLWQQSIVQITSPHSSTSFGTGFIIGIVEEQTYVLTCAHVIEALGEPTSIQIRGRQVVLEAMGNGSDVDIAVLRVSRSPADDVILLSFDAPIDTEVSEVLIVGYHSYDKHRARRPLTARLTKPLLLENKTGTVSVSTWELEITSERKLAPGYSGSPVFDRVSKKAIGLIAYKEADGGVMISLENLLKVWPKPRLGRAPDNRAANVKEDSIISNSARSKEEVRFERKKTNYRNNLSRYRGKRKAKYMFQHAESIRYDIRILLGNPNHDVYLIMQMYREAEEAYIGAFDEDSDPMYLVSRASLLIEQTDENNELDAFHLCEEAVDLDGSYNEAHQLLVKVGTYLDGITPDKRRKDVVKKSVLYLRSIGIETE